MTKVKAVDYLVDEGRVANLMKATCVFWEGRGLTHCMPLILLSSFKLTLHKGWSEVDYGRTRSFGSFFWLANATRSYRCMHTTGEMKYKEVCSEVKRHVCGEIRESDWETATTTQLSSTSFKTILVYLYVNCRLVHSCHYITSFWAENGLRAL